MRRIAVPKSTLRALLRYATVALTALTVVSTGPLEALMAVANAPDIPAPLSVAHVPVSDAPLSFYLPFLAGPEWTSDSQGFSRNDSSGTTQPPPVIIHDVPYVPYRLHEFSDAVAVELPSSDGRQVIVLDRDALGSSVYGGNDSASLAQVAVQDLVFETYREPVPASDSIEFSPEPVASPSWQQAAVSDVILSLVTQADRVIIRRSFSLTSDGEVFTGSVDVVFGFDGFAGINKWTYRIDAAVGAPAFRLRATVDIEGEVQPEHAGGRHRYQIRIPETAPVLDIIPSVTPTPDIELPAPSDALSLTPVPDEQPADSPAATPPDIESLPAEDLVPAPTNGSPFEPFVPAPAVPLELVPTSLINRIRSALVPTVHAEDGTPAPEAAPAETPTAEPSAVPIPIDTPTTEPTAESMPTDTPTPELSTVPSSGPVASASPASTSEPSPSADPDTIPVVTPPTPPPLQLALDWLRRLFAGTAETTVTLAMDSRDHRGPLTVTEEGTHIVMTYETADDTPDDAAFFVDPSFGTESADTGITVTSGDGTGAADFRIHFNPVYGGAIDELYTGADFTTTKVAVPASVSGSLSLTNIATFAQAEHPAHLTVLESSPVRVIVESELSLTATGSAPASLRERYAIYPSGRVIHMAQVTTTEPTNAVAFFNASAAALHAGYTDTEQAGQVYLADAGADLLMFWHDPATIASASVDTAMNEKSRSTSYSIPVPGGQTTWYQLIELTQNDLDPLLPDTFRRHPADYRNPDEPAMTRGSFLGFAPDRSAYRFEAVNNVVVFRLNGNDVPRINPTFEISNWSDPDLTAFKAQLNGANMQEGVDYVVGFKDDDPSTGILLFQYLHTITQGDLFNAEGQPLPPLFDIDPNDAAAIKRVQRGTATIPGSGTQVTVNLPFAVTTSRAFVVGGDQWGGGSTDVTDGDANRLEYWLADPTTLLISRGRNVASVASTTWQVIEFEDNAGAFVQRGSLSMGIADVTATATLPVSVNTNKAFPLHSVSIEDIGANQDERWTITASLSASALDFTRAETGDAAHIAWQVVQLDGISVQSGQTTLSGTSRNTDQAISSVNTAKSFVVTTASTGTGTEGADAEYEYAAQLTSNTQLRFTRDVPNNGANNLERVIWYVVTFGAANGGPRTQASTRLFSASDTKVVVTPLPRAVIATRSFAINHTYGGAPNTGNALLDDLTIYPELNSSGASLKLGRDVAAFAATASWQIIEFTRPSIEQNRYRWRNDDGSETTATWAAAENASISMQVGTPFRLRFGLYNADTGSATNQYRLEFARKAAGGNCTTGLSPGWSYQAVPVTATLASHAFDIEDSANLTNAAPTTDSAGITNDDSVFVAGETDDTTNQTTSIGLASTSFTEIEFALRANANAVGGGKYCFRLTDAGEARASHSFIFYPRYAEAQAITIPPTLTQNAMRWYANADSTAVSDPWTPGAGTTGSQIYAAAGADTYVVPAGVTSITVKSWGAGGGGGGGGTSGIGGAGGGGGFSQATLSVTPGESLSVYVGGGGGKGDFSTGTGGQLSGDGGGGGGHSILSRSGTPLIISGSGGGGGGGDNSSVTAGGQGGPGGGSSGTQGGASLLALGGGGGTSGAGGAAGTGGANIGTDGSALAGGLGADGRSAAGADGSKANGGGASGGAGGNGDSAGTGWGAGGGGGSGNYGGGGGSGSVSGSAGGGGGGGGSGYVTGTSTTMTAGSGATPANTGDPDYGGGAGVGGSGGPLSGSGTNGAAGRMVISYAASEPGAADLAENEDTVNAQWAAPNQGDKIRLRMSVQVATAEMAALSQAFKLQFAEVPVGTGGCGIVASWTDVGASTSGEVWRFGSNAAATDGTTLGGTLLSVTDVAGSYEEGNTTALNPSSVSVGQDIEYDFSLQNNTASGGSLYCFRMVKSDGSALTAYTRYPAIITPPSPNNMGALLRHGEFFSVQGQEQPYYWAEIW